MTIITFAGAKFMRRTVCSASSPWRCFTRFWSSQIWEGFYITSIEILNTAKDPVLLNVISKMCERMFDVQINCSFDRKQKILEQTGKDLVKFLLQTTVDIKHHLKYKAHEESIDLPSGYIESPYSSTTDRMTIGSFKIYHF